MKTTTRVAMTALTTIGLYEAHQYYKNNIDTKAKSPADKGMHTGRIVQQIHKTAIAKPDFSTVKTYDGSAKPSESKQGSFISFGFFGKSKNISEAKQSLYNKRLLEAVSRGDTETIRVVLEKGANINAKEPHTGATVLHLAIVFKHPELIQFLIDNKADVQAQDNDGFTALHLANMRSKSRIVSVLLASGANKEIKNSLGFTALHTAVFSERIENVQILLDNQVDIEARDNTGCTALYIAALKGNPKIIEMLLSYGAQIENKDLMQKSTPLHAAAWSGNSQAIQSLLNHGASIDSEDKDGSTPLLVALTCKNIRASVILAKAALFKANA
jgi:ankyrin repeat protein